MWGIVMVIERIGQQFGSYRLTRFLGQGGFAEVYLGEHVHLKSQVAVKVLHTRLIAHQQEQFLREAHTIASLDHPGIVRMLDCGVERGMPFLIMTYAPHGSLRQLYPEGTCLPIADILAYVRPIASVLAYAHEHKLIHRDIKPENILLGAQKEVLLSDFGIAVVSSSSISPDTKEVAGTIAYMAPEQIMGKPRPASDQYALGVVVYEWLCGELPFSGTFLETCTQHLYAPPPSLREKNPALSPALEKVVFKALAKEPEQRFASIQDFADALEECVKPSVPHYYSTIRLPHASLFTPSTPSSLNGAAIKGVLATRRRLFWLCIIGICLLISTLPVFAPALLQRLSTRTPSLISLAVHTYQPPTIRSQVAPPVPSRTSHRVQTTVLPTSSPASHPTPGITPTSTPSSLSAKATPGGPSRVIIPSPIPTTAPPVAPSPTPGSSLQLQVTPASLAPQVCSERPGYWECNVTLTASGPDSGRLRWSMALSGGSGYSTTPILHGRLMAGESRPIIIYIPNDPFAGSCTSTSLIFSSSANTVTVPWTCP
jgi:serine/threonine protein kinase